MAPSLEDARGSTAVIVSFEDSPSGSVLDHVRSLGTLHTVYDIIDAAHATVPADRLDRLAALDEVTRVDHDAPLDKHLDRSTRVVQAGPALTEQGISGANVSIAVVDTGIDSSHPGVGENFRRGVVFTGSGGEPVESDASTDADGHGTHVAGITGGTGASSQTLDPDDTRYAGVAPEAGLVALDISASFTTSTAIRAFEWVHDNHETYDIEVVQNSWGRKETGQAYDPEDPAVRASNALIAEDDLVVVFSAGNAGSESSTLAMEAANPNVIAVGATDDSRRVAEFSSRGPVVYENGTQAGWTKPDVAAPGVGIRSAASSGSTDPGTLYKDLSGTSQAAPHVAGIAALMRSQVPDLPAREIHAILEDTAGDLGPEGPDPATGHGMVNAPRALEAALEAANGTFGTITRTFTSNGTLVVGPLGDGLLEDEGASAEVVRGGFPVGKNAQELTFRFTWETTQGDPPDLRVRLTDPAGRDLRVPAQDGLAERSVSQPPVGEWSWEAQGASNSDAGAVEYQSNATVVSQRPSLTQAAGGDDAFFEQTFQDRAESTYRNAAETYGQGPVLAVLAALAVILLSLLVAVVSRVGS